MWKHLRTYDFQHLPTHTHSPSLTSTPSTTLRRFLTLDFVIHRIHRLSTANFLNVLNLTTRSMILQVQSRKDRNVFRKVIRSKLSSRSIQMRNNAYKRFRFEYHRFFSFERFHEFSQDLIYLSGTAPPTHLPSVVLLVRLLASAKFCIPCDVRSFVQTRRHQTLRL